MTLKLYDDLKHRIRLISTSDDNYKHLCSLVTRHFEGEYMRDRMPDALFTLLHDWEQEQRECM